MHSPIFAAFKHGRKSVALAFSAVLAAGALFVPIASANPHLFCSDANFTGQTTMIVGGAGADPGCTGTLSTGANSIYIDFRAASDSTVIDEPFLYMQFNGDTALHYHTLLNDAYSTPGDSILPYYQDYCKPAVTAGRVSGHGTVFGGAGRIVIPMAFLTGLDKVAVTHSGHEGYSGAPSALYFYNDTSMCYWESTAAITSITFTLSAGNFQFTDFDVYAE